MVWIAYCTICNKVLDQMENGEYTEAVGRIHNRETKHTVIIGYAIKSKET